MYRMHESVRKFRETLKEEYRASKYSAPRIGRVQFSRLKIDVAKLTMFDHEDVRGLFCRFFVWQRADPFVVLTHSVSLVSLGTYHF